MMHIHHGLRKMFIHVNCLEWLIILPILFVYVKFQSIASLIIELYSCINLMTLNYTHYNCDINVITPKYEVILNVNRLYEWNIKCEQQNFGSFYMHIHVHVLYFSIFPQRVFALSVMIIGIVSYGYIIATVAASLANADSGRARYQEKLKAINNYLQVCNYVTL